VHLRIDIIDGCIMAQVLELPWTLPLTIVTQLDLIDSSFYNSFRGNGHHIACNPMMVLMNEIAGLLIATSMDGLDKYFTDVLQSTSPR